MSRGEGNPQLEDGFARIANEILDEIAKTPLRDYEARCIHFLWRKTYGWHDSSHQAKKMDAIAYSQWAAGTGISRRHVYRTLRGLVDRRIITKSIVKREGKNTLIFWGFQKRYGQWISQLQLFPDEGTVRYEVSPNQGTPEADVSPNEGTVTDEVSPNQGTVRYEVSPERAKVSPNQGTEVSPNEAHTKDNKDNITKDMIPVSQKTGRKPKTSTKVSPEIKDQMALVFEGLKSRRGYNSPRAGGEAAAIRWMLGQGYSVAQILKARDTMNQDSFWEGKFLDMQSVKAQIGEVLKRSNGAVSTAEELRGWRR